MKTVAGQIGMLSQEIKDFKAEIIPQIRDIYNQTRKTNGSIAKACTDIELMKQNYDTCPARVWIGSPNRTNEIDISLKKQVNQITIYGVLISFVVILIQVATFVFK